MESEGSCQPLILAAVEHSGVGWVASRPRMTRIGVAPRRGTGTCDIIDDRKPTIDDVASLDLPQHLGPDGRVHLLVFVVVLGLQLDDLPASWGPCQQAVQPAIQSSAGLSGACLGGSHVLLVGIPPPPKGPK